MTSIEDKLLNPAPGSAAAKAKELGIDLALVVERLRMTPEERVRVHQKLVRDSIEDWRTSASQRGLNWDEMSLDEREMFTFRLMNPNLKIPMPDNE